MFGSTRRGTGFGCRLPLMQAHPTALRARFTLDLTLSEVRAHREYRSRQPARGRAAYGVGSGNPVSGLALDSAVGAWLGSGLGLAPPAPGSVVLPVSATGGV